MSPRPLLLALPALLMLGGCDWFEGDRPRPQPVAAPATPPPPPPPAAAAPNAAPSPMDGRYAGTLRRAHGAASSCRPASIPASATVANGRVAMNLGRYGRAEGDLGSDSNASLSGSDLNGQATFSGRRLGGEVQRGNCTYDLNLTRRGR